jgi:4-amino-4-deoxy-L-arabinose transferase-like glycosyltransferase
VLALVGTLTAYLYGTDQAIIVGQNIMEWWFLAGLAVMILTPIFRLIGIGHAVTVILIRFARKVLRKR